MPTFQSAFCKALTKAMYRSLTTLSSDEVAQTPVYVLACEIPGGVGTGSEVQGSITLALG